MSALDQAIADLDARRAQDSAARRARQEAAAAFLKSFHTGDLATSERLKSEGIEAAFDEARIMLRRPAEGVYAEGMMIVVGEQGEIDVNGRSLGPVGVDDGKIKTAMIAEIIAHFSL